VSLPNAKSAEPVSSRDGASHEGWLAETPVPDLLARAQRVAYTGTLVLSPADAEPSSVVLVDGAVVRAGGPWRTRDLEWEVLGRFLPPETLEFAAQHATDYGVDPFQAVERLVLLPHESLASARQSLTVLGVQAMSRFAGETRYRFLTPSVRAEGDTEPEVAVEPLGLLVECFLVDPHRERAARAVAGFEHATLSFDPERVRRVLGNLHGPMRAVLESLVRTPGSVQMLRERGLVSPDELTACVCALWITCEVTVRGHGASQTFAAVRQSAAPVPAQASSAPPAPAAVAEILSSLPPRRDSGFVRAQTGPPDGGAREHAMELKVEEAWMLAEADPARAAKIGGVVLKAVSVFPKNPRLRYYLARVHIKAHRLEEAISELEQVLALDPEDVDAKNELERLRELLPVLEPSQ